MDRLEWKWIDRADPGDPRSRMTQHSQDPGVKPPGSVINVTRRDQKLKKDPNGTQCGPVTLETPPDVEQQVQDTNPEVTGRD